MPSSRAQARPEGLLVSWQVSHRKTYRRIISPSSLLRQGRGGRQFGCAFLRFRIEDSYDGMRDPPLFQASPPNESPELITGLVRKQRMGD